VSDDEPPGRLIVVSGAQAAGRTTVAYAVAARLPRAIHNSSHVLRLDHHLEAHIVSIRRPSRITWHVVVLGRLDARKHFMCYNDLMTRIGVRELRQNASRYLALVKAGETVEVTERGALVALLVSPQRCRTARDRLVAAGRLIPAANPSGRLRSSRPVPVAIGEPTNQELLDAEREERL